MSYSRQGLVQFVHKYTFLCLLCYIFQRDRAIPVSCIAANCSATTGKDYSPHEFPWDETLHEKWVQAVQHYWINCIGLSSSSVLCSTHTFLQIHGYSCKKRLNHNAVSTILSRPTYGESSKGNPISHQQRTLLSTAIML